MISKAIKILTACFFINFFAWNGVQQFLTTYFSSLGQVRTGFWSLVIIYVFLLVSNIFSGFFVSRLGLKKCLLFSPLFYSLFIFSVASNNPVFIYISSALLGFGASLLWNAQGCLLIRESGKNAYGKNAGFFNTFLQIGSILGIIVFGFLAAKASFNLSFLSFAFLPLVSAGIFAFLENTKSEEVNFEEDLSGFRKMITDPSVFKISLVWFSYSLVLGSVVGQIPLEVRKYFNLQSLGMIMPLFYILPIILSYYFGKKSDIKGWRGLLVLSCILVVLGFGLFALQSNLELGKWFFALCFLLISLGYAIFAPLSLSLRGEIDFKGKLEHLTAITILFGNAGYVVCFLLNLFLSTSLSYLVSFFIVFLSLIVILSELKSNKRNIKEQAA